MPLEQEEPHDRSSSPELARLEALVPKWRVPKTEVEMLTHAAVSECRLLRARRWWRWSMASAIERACDCGMTTEMGLSWLKMIEPSGITHLRAHGIGPRIRYSGMTGSWGSRRDSSARPLLALSPTCGAGLVQGEDDDPHRLRRGPEGASVMTPCGATGPG